MSYHAFLLSVQMVMMMILQFIYDQPHQDHDEPQHDAGHGHEGYGHVVLLSTATVWRYCMFSAKTSATFSFTKNELPEIRRITVSWPCASIVSISSALITTA